MASLRTACMKTYSIGEGCLSFLSSLTSSYSLNYEDHTYEEYCPTHSKLSASVSEGFRRI